MHVNNSKKTIHIILSTYYADISHNLYKNILKSLIDHGHVGPRFIHHVYGSYEIPTALAILLRNIDHCACGFIVSGCIIKGSTDHAIYLEQELLRSILDLSISHMIPLGYNVISGSSKSQVVERIEKKSFESVRALFSLMRMKYAGR